MEFGRDALRSIRKNSLSVMICLLFAFSFGEARRKRVVVVGHQHHFVKIHHRGGHYFHRDGFFYRRHHRGYILAPAPIGFVVAVLPLGAVLLHAGGHPHYYCGGVYYRKAPDGYAVVSKPDTVLVIEADSAQGRAEAPMEFQEPSADTVMVGNDNESQTPIRLEHVGSQWKGPRGELYDSLPTSAQLQTVYGL